MGTSSLRRQVATEAIFNVNAGQRRDCEYTSIVFHTVAKLPFFLFNVFHEKWSIRTWYINHVAHHKWSDTDADPHNVKRGLFFAHGFFMYKKQHPLSAIKEQQIDLTVLMADPIVKFQFEYAT